MSVRVHAVPHQREIIDRRAVDARLAGADRASCAVILKEALAEIEPDSLAPREALELVYRLKRLLAEQGG